MDVATLVALLKEAADQHHHYEATAPEHEWSAWYAAYVNAREQGSSPEGAYSAAGVFVESPRDAMGAGSGRHHRKRSVSSGHAEHVGAVGGSVLGEGAEVIARLEDDRLDVPLTRHLGKPRASGPPAAGPRVDEEHRPLWGVGASPTVAVLSPHRRVHGAPPEAAIGTS